MFRKVCSFTIALFERPSGQYAFATQPMEQLHADSTVPDDNHNLSEEPLSDYVKRMETAENLKKLAKKLERDLKNPISPEEQNVATPGVDTPDVSTPDLSFEKFEEKLKQGSGQ
jgi:hypothetical protein